LLIEKMGLNNYSSWALILSNLVYSPQINWYIKNIKFDELYSKTEVISLLNDAGAKETWANDIWSSFGRILELPFSNVGFGIANKERNKFVSLTRKVWNEPDPKVILYSLYKFAEKCEGYYGFTLERLYNFDIESAGVSPIEIFGIERETMKKILSGLSINYPDYISTTFSLDLDNINLKEGKTSKDVLELF